jgi:predicted nucleotidyltransferase
MGNTKSNSIADVLFSGVQQRVLGLLFGQPDRSFYTNELAKLGKTGRGSLQRELERLTASGLVEMRLVGHQKHYQANKNSIIFQELRSISLKTFGLAEVLRDALSTHQSAIKFAFIFGSIAKGTDSSGSDIDIMVIADDLGYSELFEDLTKAETLLGRKVSPTLYSTNDFLKKKREDNHFISRVFDQPKIVLLGAEHDIEPAKPAQPVEDRQAQG